MIDKIVTLIQTSLQEAEIPNQSCKTISFVRLIKSLILQNEDAGSNLISPNDQFCSVGEGWDGRGLTTIMKLIILEKLVLRFLYIYIFEKWGNGQQLTDATESIWALR